MTGQTQIRTLETKIARLEAEIEKLKTIILRRPRADMIRPIVFQRYGGVAVTTSHKMPVRASRRLTFCSIQLDTAGSSTTTVQILKNGVVQGSAMSLGSGVTQKFVAISIQCSRGDYIQVQVTAAGTGADGLVIELDEYQL